MFNSIIIALGLILSWTENATITCGAGDDGKMVFEKLINDFKDKGEKIDISQFNLI